MLMPFVGIFGQVENRKRLNGESTNDDKRPQFSV